MGNFDPKEHLVRMRGRGGASDYLEVKWRLVWLREEHPDARVESQLIEHDRQNGFALFRAEVTIPSGGSAVDYGSETAKDFADYLEKASTKAIGRALGALGYGTQFAQDYEMGREADGTPRAVVDSPAPSPRPDGETVARLRAERQAPAPAAPRPPVGGADEPLTDAQRKTIFAWAGKMSLDKAALDKLVDQAAKGKTVSALTRGEASSFIDALHRRHGEMVAAGGQQRPADEPPPMDADPAPETPPSEEFQALEMTAAEMEEGGEPWEDVERFITEQSAALADADKDRARALYRRLKAARAQRAATAA